MFNSKEIKELTSSLDNLMQDFSQFAKENILLKSKIKETQDQIERMEINNERTLVGFHKEITDRYFDTLEKILRVHTESSIVTALAHQINEKDLNNLKSSLMQPFLEAKWASDKAERGQKIANNGVAIIEERKRLHDEILSSERQGLNVDKEKERLVTFDWVLSALNNGEKK